MAIKNERLMSGYTGCIGCKHELLCDICPYWDGQSGTKMAERISATIGAERISQGQIREMLNKNK